jgi:hypothetical protein
LYGRTSCGAIETSLVFEPQTTGGFPSSPHVILSPKATKLVAAIVGIFGGTYGSTTTGKEHESFRLCASVAVHTTVVEPTGNVLPLAGTHDVFTDGAPPFTDAAPYETARPNVLDAGAGTGAAGHRIFGPVLDGFVGPADDPQAAADKAAANVRVDREIRQSCSGSSTRPGSR